MRLPATGSSSAVSCRAVVSSPCPGLTPLLPHHQAGFMGIAGHQAYPGQLLAMTPPQGFAIHRNGPPRPQPRPAPPGQGGLEGGGGQPPEYGMETANGWGTGPGETHGLYRGGILLAAPLVDGVEAAGAESMAHTARVRMAARGWRRPRNPRGPAPRPRWRAGFVPVQSCSYPHFKAFLKLKGPGA